MMLSQWFSFAAAGCSAIAAMLWAIASRNPSDPPAGAFAEQIVPQLDAWRRCANRAASMNRWAAVLSGIAACFGIASALL